MKKIGPNEVADVYGLLERLGYINDRPRGKGNDVWPSFYGGVKACIEDLEQDPENEKFQELYEKLYELGAESKHVGAQLGLLLLKILESPFKCEISIFADEVHLCP